MDRKPEEHNWYTLTRLVTKVEEQLRVIFANRWKSLYDSQWTDNSLHDQVSYLFNILGPVTFKSTMGTSQRKILYSGEPSQLDLSTMAKILQNMRGEKSGAEAVKENKNVQSVIEIWNILAHCRDKIVNIQDFKKYWSILQPIANVLGVPEHDISEIEISQNSFGIVEKYNGLKGEANDLFKKGDFDGAINLYSKALTLSYLSHDQLGVLYSNRSISYLKEKNNDNNMINLAFSDAQNCKKFCPNWFKSHWRIAEAHMAMGNFKEALISYDKAVFLEPNDQKLLEARSLFRATLIDKEIKWNPSGPNLSPDELFAKLKNMPFNIPFPDPRSIDIRPYNEPEELEKATENGSKFASELQKALAYKNRILLHSAQNKSPDKISEQDLKDIITEFGQIFQIGEFVAVVRPHFTTDFQKTLLKFVKKILDKNEICQLDKWARLCYVFLNKKFHVETELEMMTFLTEAIEKYPKVSRFYDLKLSLYSILDDLKTGSGECEKYLKLFPKDLNLLYYRASVLKDLMISYEFDQFEEIIEAYKEFIIEAGPDHCKTPDAYYSLGLVHMYKDAKNHGHCFLTTSTGCFTVNKPKLLKTKEYLEKGLKAENLQFLHFQPYKSNSKEMVTTMIEQLNSNPITKSKVVSKDCKNCDDKSEILEANLNLSPKNEPTREYLSNPKRIQLIKKARQYSNILKVREDFSSTSTEMVKGKCLKAPKSLTGLKEIHLVDMNPIKDRIYAGKLIKLTVIDDPNFFSSTIHLVVQDDLFDVTLLSLYNFDRRGKSIEKYFGFGCKFTLLNPYMRMATDGQPTLRVDDLKSVIFQDNENLSSKKLCHYCSAENSKHSCSKCKTNYCSRECQVNDWKILQHKLVCWKK